MKLFLSLKFYYNCMSKDSKIKDVLEKQLDIQKGILENSKEHKEIAKKQSKDSMSLKEQRNWNILFVVLAIIGVIGLGIFLNQITSFFQPHITPDYDISVQVSPNQIKLNERKGIDFIFTFTNIGKRNLTDFSIFEIDIYRKKDGIGGLLYSPSQNKGEYLDCGQLVANAPIDNFESRKSCTLKVSTYPSDGSIFDDKDNPPQFLVYIRSTPPIGNKIVNTTIY